MNDAAPVPMSVAELRIRLMLDGFYMPRLEFERWRVENVRDPEHFGVRNLASPHYSCSCARCQTTADEQEEATS